MMTFAMKAAEHTVRHCNDFIQGLENLKEYAIPLALQNFQRAYDAAPFDDIYHNKYASYCGLARVLTGDRSGIELCRDVASREAMDGDVFLNLAYVEWHMKSRKRTVGVLEKGLKVDEHHPGLNKLQTFIGVRKKSPITFIRREHFLNKTLGKIVRKRETSAESWTLQQLL